jgi:hypothetical protein
VPFEDALGDVDCVASTVTFFEVLDALVALEAAALALASIDPDVPPPNGAVVKRPSRRSAPALASAPNAMKPVATRPRPLRFAAAKANAEATTPFVTTAPA